MVRVLKIAIETNLFISICAVAFLWANTILLGIPLASVKLLSFQVFFSTWFVYQISRWIYFKKDVYVNSEELILLWFKKHPVTNQVTIFLSGLATLIFSLFLKWKTILVLSFIGSISLLYPFPVLLPFGVKTRLRDFPAVKIFLIACVWSVTSVVLPSTEAQLEFNERKDIFILLLTQFLFIFFITLPFDINDIEADKSINVKTIPTLFGIKATQFICLVIGCISGILLLYLFMLENWRKMDSIYLSEYSIISIWILLLFLQIFTFFKADKVPKWIIKLVYDGSMIVYCLLFLFFKI